MDMAILKERWWKSMKENNPNHIGVKGNKEVKSIGDMFFRFLDAFRKFWYISVILMVILGIFGYFYYKKTYVPTYESRAIFSVTATDYSGSGKFTHTNNNQLTEDLSVSFNYLINNEVFYEIIKQDLGLSYVPATIEIISVENTNILNIKTSSADAKMAYKTIQSVLNNYSSVTAFVVGDTKLKVIEQPTQPTEPINPYMPIKGVLLFALIGFAIGMIPVFIVGLFVKTIQTGDDVNKYLSIYLFGNVPFINAENAKGEKVTDFSILNKDVGFRFLESMRSISSRCERVFKQNNAKVIVVTSTKSGEGKSTFTMNLAYSLSKMQHKVMLIDGDLRKPSLKKKVKAQTPSYSLGDYLDGKIKSSQAITNLKDTRVIAITPDKKTENAADVINSDNMRSFIEDVKSVVDYVIIDAPPCTGLSDAAALAQYSDGIVYVIKESSVRVNKVINSLQEFAYTKKPVLGCILNGSLEGSKSSYVYGKYAYGKYGYGVRRRGYGGGQYGMYGYGYGDSPRARYGYSRYGKKYGYGYGYGYGDEIQYGYNGTYGEYGKTSEKEFDTSVHKLTKHIKMSSTDEEKKADELKRIEEEKKDAEEKANPKTWRQIKKEEKEIRKKIKQELKKEKSSDKNQTEKE